MDKSIGTDENGVIVTDGLVLREITLNENDRLLTVLTGEHGRMTVLARGVKNLTSKRAYGLTPFSYSTFEFEKKGEKLRFHDSNVKKSFFDINDSVEGFALASYICEAAGECAMENNDESELLRLCLNMLFSVENKLKPVHILKADFELKAACVLGFMPDTEYSYPPAHLFRKEKNAMRSTSRRAALRRRASSESSVKLLQAALSCLGASIMQCVTLSLRIRKKCLRFR